MDILRQKLLLQQELKRIRGESEILVPTTSLYEWLEEGRESMDEARQAIERFTQTEEELLIQRKQHQDLYRQIAWIVLCALGLVGTTGTIFAIHLCFQLERELEIREITLKATNGRLEIACNQLQRFTSNASHELRAPLAAVLSNAQVGLMDLDEPEEATLSLRGRLEKIITLTKQMSTLVDELLFLARHEGLLAADTLQEIDLTALLRQLVTEWLPQTKAYLLQLITQLPGDAVLVSADVPLLRQAIANLLNNACRYTPAGGCITVNLEVVENQAVVSVEDTGSGIPTEALSHIFERFYRVDPQRSKVSGGQGLGLAIAQQIIQAHGGDIRVTSQVGQGSTFQIRLPLTVSETAESLSYSGHF